MERVKIRPGSSSGTRTQGGCQRTDERDKGGTGGAREESFLWRDNFVFCLTQSRRVSWGHQRVGIKSRNFGKSWSLGILRDLLGTRWGKGTGSESQDRDPNLDGGTVCEDKLLDTLNDKRQVFREEGFRVSWRREGREWRKSTREIVVKLWLRKGPVVLDFDLVDENDEIQKESWRGVDSRNIKWTFFFFLEN